MNGRLIFGRFIVLLILLSAFILAQPVCGSEGGSGDFRESSDFFDFFTDIYNAKVSRMNNQNTSLQTAHNLEKALPLFDAYVNDIFRQGVTPGMAVAVIYQDRVVYQKCFGVKKNGTSDPIDGDTVFQIGSHSKPFTSATLASLVDDGIIEWDDRIVKYYPEFRMYDPWVSEHMTFRDALVHRSGLPSHAAGELMTPFNYNASEILYRIRYLEPASDFRTRYEYQNVMFLLAGEAAARATGKPWPDLIQERIFTPLEMHSTSARFDDYINAENRISNHAEKNGTFMVVDPLDYDPLAPAGGVSSSINDMAKWVIFHVNNGGYKGEQIVSPESLSETHRIQIVESSADDYVAGYGLGWFLTYVKSGMVLHHGGSVMSSTSYVVILPEEEIGIVVLCNKGPSPSLPMAVCYTFKDLVRKGKPGTDYYASLKLSMDPWFEGTEVDMLPPAPLNATPALPPEAYTGRYSSDYYGVITIEPQGNGLAMYMGNNPVPLNLTHWSGNIFQEDSSKTPVNFTAGEGNISSLVLVKGFDFDGRNGTFIRVQDT